MMQEQMRISFHCRAHLEAVIAVKYIKEKRPRSHVLHICHSICCSCVGML